MRVAVVVPRSVPYVVGGAERLYDGLVAAIGERPGHTAELIAVDSPEHSFGQLVDSYSAFGALDLTDFDHVISTKYPSWMVRHRSHAVYMLHTLRGLYDTYTGPQADPAGTDAPEVLALRDVLRTAPGSRDGWRTVLRVARATVDALGDDHPALAFPGPLCRSLIHWLDRDALDPRNVGRFAAISRTVARRRDYFPHGAAVDVLPPPSSLQGLHEGPYQALFTVSRLDPPKRIELIIEAMRYVGAPVRLRIAGTGPDEGRLKELAAADGRIEFLGRISDLDLVAEYSRALAVPFVPKDEDFGLVALEAHLAAKPVITCTDSGGVSDTVIDGVDGIVTAPAAGELGRAMQRLAEDPDLAARLGTNGRRSAQTITWDPVVDTLLAGPAPAPAPVATRTRSRRDRVIVLSTYGLEPVRHGGQLRARSLADGLTDRWDVDVLALDTSVPGGTTLSLGPRMTQYSRPVSSAHVGLESQIAHRVGVPIGDIAASLLIAQNPAFLSLVGDLGARASVAVLAHPYLLPALRIACPNLPFVYDAHNAETVMKSEIYGDNPAAQALTQAVRAVERAAVRGAELVTVCSEDDRASLCELGPSLASWELVPNGYDVAGTPFTTGADRRRNRDRWLAAKATRSVHPGVGSLALFVGSYHKPNLEAVDFIVELAPCLPDTLFVIAGGVGEHLDPLGRPSNIVATGRLSDSALAQLLASADVSLNPMVSGGGTNIKLMESFAAGVPVVSTPLGARGVDVADGRELLLADPALFAAAVHTCVTDRAGADHRAAKARALAESGYDWSVLADRFRHAVERALTR
ncbi:MAG: glycosyltransferase [Jatrophihabitans sp.]|nr:MAG: glycosyltransferase [Jatrophihabitans sp.]